MPRPVGWDSSKSTGRLREGRAKNPLRVQSATLSELKARLSQREGFIVCGWLMVVAAAVMFLLLGGCSGEPDGTNPPDGTQGAADPAPRDVATVEPGTQPADTVPETIDEPAGPTESPPDLTPADEAPSPGPLDTPLDTPPPSEDESPPGETDGLPLPQLDPQVILIAPKVTLSSGHQAMCLVGVGDAMPSFELPDASGDSQSLTDLLGPKLTVVLFWKLDRPYAREQFERLQGEVVGPFAGYGVNTVTINSGDPAAAVQAAGQQVAATYPLLVDADGAALAAVGTGKLPRTYLLDSTGKILWFDIEYSESTRRQLKNAILWYLTKGPAMAARKPTS